MDVTLNCKNVTHNEHIILLSTNPFSCKISLMLHLIYIYINHRIYFSISPMVKKSVKKRKKME